MAQQKFFKMNEFGLSWKMKLFLGVIFTLPFIVLFWVVLADDIINPKKLGESYLLDKIKINCQGSINEIFRQKMNHNIQTLKTDYCIFGLPPKWENRFIVGDSISKKEGELFVEHYRDGELIEILDYREIAKEMKDDDWDIIKKKLNIAEDKEH